MRLILRDQSAEILRSLITHPLQETCLLIEWRDRRSSDIGQFGAESLIPWSVLAGVLVLRALAIEAGFL